MLNKKKNNMSITPAVLPLEDAAMYCCLSPSSFQRQVRNGLAPQPRKLSDRRVGWLVKELNNWLESLPVSDILPPANTGASKPQ